MEKIRIGTHTIVNGDPEDDDLDKALIYIKENMGHEAKEDLIRAAKLDSNDSYHFELRRNSRTLKLVLERDTGNGTYTLKKAD